MSAEKVDAPPSTPVESAEPPLKARKTWRERGRWLVEVVHSKVGVWAVIGALVITLVVVTIGFIYLGWPARYIPLYEADAEVAIVASALYVIVVQWPKERKETT